MINKKKRLMGLLIVFFIQIPITVYGVEGMPTDYIGEQYEKRIITIDEDSNELLRSALNEVNLDPGNSDRILNYEEKQLLEQSQKDKQSYEVLVPKTKEKYEIALSYTNGDYKYAGKASTYEEAVEIADEKGKTLLNKSSDVIIPVVIDTNGEMLYATESIGRVWKVRTNSNDTVLSYVYSDSSLTNSYTYVHDSYISEVPLIQNNENEAKVLVNGYKGWMNKNINRKASGYSYPNQDLRIQPISNVTNPSYYTVKNGTLIHYISTSMSTAGSGTSRTIGLAPSFLQEGQTYYSYDGNYFYSGTTAEALRKLTQDLQNGNYNQAVNSGNPYYNYYSYLPFRSKTNYTAAEIDKFINNNTKTTSKLRGLGQAFINAQNTYGVNALLALGIAINESAWGTSDYAMNRNNLFGINATDDNTSANTSYFSSPTSCVNEFAKYLISKGYANPKNWKDNGGFLGNKSYGANVKYASDPYWSEKAVSFAFKIDYELSNYNISNMRDNDYYQLLMFNKTSTVTNSSGDTLYNVSSSNSSSGSFVGSVVAFSKAAIKTINGNSCYEILPEITTSGTFDGIYNWNVKGYIPINSVRLMNNGKNYFDKEDVNKDTVIDSMDLSLVGKDYNSINSIYDINKDGIVDIYDISSISKKIS